MTKNNDAKKSKMSRKREKQTRYLSQAIQLEEAVNPHIIRATMLMVSVAVLTFVVWAGFTNINEVARTPGEVVPQGHQQVVQHLEGGIVREINVSEGQIVKKGDVLVVLDGSGLFEDLERAKSKNRSLKMQEERLRAFTEGREADFNDDTWITALTAQEMSDQKNFFESMRNARTAEQNVIEDQLIQKRKAIRSLRSDLAMAEKNLSITQDLYSRRAQLHGKGYASDFQLLDSKRQLNEVEARIQNLKNQISMASTEMEEYRERLASLSAQQKDQAHERMDMIIAEMAQNKEIIEKVNERIGRLNIRAPAKGVVKGLALNTVGSVVKPGDVLMEVIPMDKKLEVQVKISPQDIGHIKTGQDVQVKFSTFDFSRYGSVHGKLDYISPMTFVGEQGERYYQGNIRLERNFVGQDRGNLIIPGMTVMADIITGDKTILQYLLKPVHVALKTAFRER